MTQINDTVVKAEIDQQIAEHPVLLYMKGTANQPMCGFSARAVKALQACGVSFATVNILDRQDIRAILPAHKNWPTFPQLYVKGELIGGSDIMLEMYESGELQTLLKDSV